MGDFRETAVNYIVGEKFATFYTAEKSYIENVKSWQKEYPNEIKIKHINNDGSIICNIPKSWVKIKPPRKISDKQRELAAERFKKMWEDRNRKSDKGESND